MTRGKRLLAAISIICIISCYSAQSQDTIKRPTTLQEVVVTGSSPNTPPSIQAATVPIQVLSNRQLEQRGISLLSDAVKQMNGVAMKDYGGVGGIKTVSARGLGSQFSTLVIDGVAVNDCQNGQVDLGRYQLGFCSYVSLTNGQSDSRFPSARALSAGSIINMETRVPVFDGKRYNLSAGLSGGSFGYLSPALGYEQQLGRRTSLSLHTNHTRSTGNYPYTLYYTHNRSDSSSRETRENSQMHLTTADVNLFHQISRNQELRVKGHWMQSYHALPGPVIYYSAKGSEHSEEQLGFAQARYQLNGSRISLQVLAKYQYSSDIYEDTAARTPSHLLHNEYQQQETYLSQVLRWQIDSGGRWLIRLSADESVSALASNLSHHNAVRRESGQAALCLDYSPRRLPILKELQASTYLLGTYVRDREAEAESDPYTQLSPYAALTWRMRHVTLRYFYKESYRVPNFNELYYFTVGRVLRPEQARQHNLGLSAASGTRSTDRGTQHSYDLQLNGYWNQVSDKIIAVPTQNMFLWSMANLGEVRILGLDASLCANIDFVRWSLRADAGYSYQHATDRTDPAGKCYGHQIPYTPRHSGTAVLTAETHWLNASYAATWVGGRYSTNQNTPASHLSPYLDQGITLSKQWHTKTVLLTAKAQVLNLFDVQYEVVRNYPMMGRNYRIMLNIEL